MTRKTITASLATLVVAAAAGGSAWGVIAQGPEPATPNPAAGACYIEDPDCNDTPGFLPDPVAEPDAGLIAPDADVPDTIDPLA